VLCIESITKMYQSGMSIQSIAKEVGVCSTTVFHKLHRAGVEFRCRGSRPVRGNNLSDDETLDICEEYSNYKLNIRQLASKYSVASGVIRRCLFKNGIKFRRNWSSRRTHDGTVCSVCGSVLTESNSHKSAPCIGGRSSRCTLCLLRASRYSRYGLSLNDINEMLGICNGRCPICNKSITELTCRVDHCHDCGVVRGLLCNWCNVAIGLSKDSIETIRRMKQYLQHSDTGVVVNFTGLYSPEYSGVDSISANHRYYAYGVTDQQFNILKEAQNGVCACCGKFIPTKKFPELVIEHNHTTNHIRGLTCQLCNRAISSFNESPENCGRAVEYLLKCGCKCRSI